MIIFLTIFTFLSRKIEEKKVKKVPKEYKISKFDKRVKEILKEREKKQKET